MKSFPDYKHLLQDVEYKHFLPVLITNLTCERPCSALHGRSQRVTIPDAVKIQFWPPEDEHNIVRNMSRYLM
jgi:hypothetical protein